MQGIVTGLTRACSDIERRGWRRLKHGASAPAPRAAGRAVMWFATMTVRWTACFIPHISLSRSNAPPHTKITTAAIIHNIKQCITPNVPFPPSTGTVPKRTKAALHARAPRPATPINPSRHATPADRRRCALMLGKPYTTRTKCPGQHQRQKRELRVHAPRP